VQGDQIGIIFAHCAIVYFGQLFENYSSSLDFLAEKCNNVFRQKMARATFWAKFSQTHLVTLMACHVQFLKPVLNMVARFVLVQDTKTGENMPNDHKIYHMATKYTTWP
jgi:hypothetical protein